MFTKKDAVEYRFKCVNSDCEFDETNLIHEDNLTLRLLMGKPLIFPRPIQFDSIKDDYPKYYDKNEEYTFSEKYQFAKSNESICPCCGTVMLISEKNNVHPDKKTVPWAKTESAKLTGNFYKRHGDTFNPVTNSPNID